MTNFPLEGDCVFAYVVGVEKYFQDHEKYQDTVIDRALFIAKTDSIFHKVSKEMIAKVDFAKELGDEKYELIEKTSSSTYYGLTIYQQRESLILSIYFVDEEESLNKHSTHYGFKLFGKEDYKLYKVYCVG